MRGTLGLTCALALTAAAPAPSPWFGTWSLRLATPGEPPETLVYSDAGAGRMRMASVEQRSVLVTAFDGRPAAIAGAGPAATLAIRATSPTRYAWTFARPGRPNVRGINTLAADRRTFTEISWRVDRPAKRVALIYDRRGPARQ